MVTFLAAIMIMCFYVVDSWAKLATRLIYGCTWLLVYLLILWISITERETKNRRVVLSKLRQLFQYVRAKLTGNSGIPNSSEKYDDPQHIGHVGHALTTTVAQNANRGMPWRLRVQRLAQHSRRFASRGMTLITSRLSEGPRSSTLPLHRIDNRSRRSD